MNTYRIKLSLESTLVTPIMGDTLFGHICWGIYYNKGEKNLENFIELYKDEIPPLVISDGSPSGMLPKPMIDSELSERSLDKKRVQLRKHLKKIKYIPIEFFSKDNKISEEILIDWVEKFEKDKEKTTKEIMHNTINRLSGSVDNVYNTDEIFYKHNTIFDVYVLSIYEINKVKELFYQGLENGYGADKSTGKGKFNIKSVEIVTLNSSGNRMMSLGSFVPEEKINLSNLKADIFTKFGKLGGHYVTSYNPFKKPILMYAAGATFNTNNLKYVGVLLNNVHKLEKIKHHAMAPIINFNEEVLL